MATITARKTVSVLTVDDIAVVLRAGETIEEERVALHVLEDLDDPDSYTSSVLKRGGSRAKAKKADKVEPPPANDPSGDATGDGSGDDQTGDDQKETEPAGDAGGETEPAEAPKPKPRTRSRKAAE